MKDQVNDDMLEIRTYIKRPLVSKPGGNRLIHCRREKSFERLSRAPECTDRIETSTNVSGRASLVRELAVVPKSAYSKRKVGESMKN